MKLHSKIYRGEVTHARLGPRAHAFTYPMTFFAFDLAELPALARSLPCFAHNAPQLLRLDDRDYLDGGAAPIERRLERFIPPVGPGERTLLVTSPRYLGYAFNPVNFHLRLAGDELRAAVAEVNNTFGDRHVYPLRTLAREGARTWTARCPKDFHVSPFNDLAGHYHFTFRVEPDELFLGVDLHREGSCVMKTWMQGRAHPLTAAKILRHALLHPFDTALNSMPRILWQAALLHYRKRLPVFRRPPPVSPHTLVDRDQPKDPGVVV